MEMYWLHRRLDFREKSSAIVVMFYRSIFHIEQLYCGLCNLVTRWADSIQSLLTLVIAGKVLCCVHCPSNNGALSYTLFT